jgi:hypothetical protein
MSLIKKFQSLLLDENEKIFTESNNNLFNKNSEETILIQCTQDYFYLKLYTLVLMQESKNIKNVVGLIVFPFKTSKIDKILIIPFALKVILNRIRTNKLKKLYTSIGVSEFYSLNNLSLTNIVRSFKIFKGIKSKKAVLELKIDDIKVGDLLYDTVVRFAKEPTLSINNLDILINIYRSLNAICLVNLICNKYNISNSFFNQSVYIYHGVPVRILLKNKINVYTSGHFPMFKKLSIDDPFMMSTKNTHLKLLEEIKLDQKIIDKSLALLGERFNGKDDIGVIKHYKMNPYNLNKSNTLNSYFEGVLFLHDFYDSHKLFGGNSVFYDFDTWVRYTLNLIRDLDLKIAIKPHPLQIQESEKYLNKLKLEFDDLMWIDPLTSNLEIFNKGILYGISHHGTVLTELAYHKIKAISCSESSISAYNICYEASNLEEYKSFILNIKRLPEKENLKDLVGMYYHNNFCSKSEYIIKSKLIKGVNICETNRYNFTSKDLLINY